LHDFNQASLEKKVQQLQHDEESLVAEEVTLSYTIKILVLILSWVSY